MRKPFRTLFFTELLVLILACQPFVLIGQNKISGTINLDTSYWAPVVHLSHIPNFSELNTISYKNIIASTEVLEDGSFEFSTELLSVDNQIYRIHFSKKGDPAASMIIGGKDENHFYIIASNSTNIKIDIRSDRKLLDKITVTGDDENQQLSEVRNIISMLEMLNEPGTSINYEFIHQAVNDRLREFADTSTHPLVSLYAIYNSDYEADYLTNADFYRGLIRRFKKEKDEYFQDFKKTILEDQKSNWLTIILITVVLGVFIWIIVLIQSKKKKPEKNRLSDLTIQERKVFALLKEGKSNKEIAEECSVSVSTVKSHVNNIYSKLGVSSRKEVVDF